MGSSPWSKGEEWEGRAGRAVGRRCQSLAAPGARWETERGHNQVSRRIEQFRPCRRPPSWRVGWLRPMAETSDSPRDFAELLARAKDGDRQAQNDLFAKYLDELGRAIAPRLG